MNDFKNQYLAPPMVSKANIRQSAIMCARRGNTTYLLNSALHNPEVIIVFAHQIIADNFRKEFEARLRLFDDMRYKEYLDAGKEYPIFTGIRNLECYLYGTKSIPVVFDLSVMDRAGVNQ